MIVTETFGKALILERYFATAGLAGGILRHGEAKHIAQVADEAVAALCAEAVGCFAEMQAITLDYLKTRKQFGSITGSFQVLQHRADDMFVELKQSRSMAMCATMMAGENDATERQRAISAAKAKSANRRS